MSDMESELERAARYEAAKDDPNEWESEAVEAKSPRRRLGSMVSIRLTAEELNLVREKAEEVGLSVSAFIRRAALGQAKSSPALTYVNSAAFRADLIWLSDAGSQSIGPVPMSGSFPR